MTSEQSFQRRRYPRFRVSMLGSVTSPLFNGEEMSSQVIDISRYGIRCEGSLELSVGDKMVMNLALPDGRKAIVGVRILHRRAEKGRAVWGGALSFPREDGRRKIHSLVSSLPSEETASRRRRQRRIDHDCYINERRCSERRRDFGIFEPCVAFASRAKEWDKVSTLFRCAEGISPVRIVLDGRSLISFGSKDYLGLSHHPRVKEAVVRSIERYGTHSAGSRAVNGTNPVHLELQNELAKMLNAQDALVFPSGYLANFAILSSLLKKGDIAYVDERVHASMIDGCLASGATVIRFRHNSPGDLAKKLARTQASRSLILIEGVYSTEGDLCPLSDMRALSVNKRIPIMLDDGHGFGILGENGAGTAQYFGMNGQVELYVGLFSKVFGSLGGFVASSREVTDYLLRTSRGIIFTTALPVGMAAGVLEGLRIVQQDSGLRQRLWSNVTRMKEGLERLGFHPTGGASPILTIRVNHEHVAYRVAKALEEHGVYVNTFVRPAVKRGESIVRLTISAAHTDADMDSALAGFATVKPMFDKDGSKEAGNLQAEF